MDLQFKIGMGRKIYPVLFDEAVFIDQSVIDYQVKITKEGYKDVLTFEVETKEPSDGLKERLVDSISHIMEIEDAMNEDLLDTPRVEFVDIGTMEYTIKAKKIVDLRENYD